MDTNGKGTSLMGNVLTGSSCFASMLTHNRLLILSNMPAAERRVLVFGSIPHGLGNRLGAYVSYFCCAWLQNVHVAGRLGVWHRVSCSNP